MKPLIFAAILLQLSAVPTYKIKGHVTTLSGMAQPQTLTLRTYGQGVGSMNLRSVPVQSDGAFEILNAAAGEYSLSLGDPFNSPSRNFTFRDADVTDFEIKVPVMVTGRILAADGGAVGGDYVVSAATQVTATNIHRDAPKTMVSRTSPDPNGNFTLAVFPGDNSIGVDRVPGGFTVASITYDRTNLQLNALRLTAVPTSTVVVTVARKK